MAMRTSGGRLVHIVRCLNDWHRRRNELARTLAVPVTPKQAFLRSLGDIVEEGVDTGGRRVRSTD
jgi:hypothetical protein